MALILSILCEKGGTGKTTTTINAAKAFARDHYKVCVIDLDPQMSLTRTYQAVTQDRPTIFDVLMEKVSAIEAVQESKVGIDIIPADSELSRFALGGAELPGAKENHPYQLRKVLKELENEYDFICIDNSPSLSLLSINSLTASTNVVIPAAPDDYSLQSVENTLETIDYVKEEFNPDLSVEGILLTRYNPRSSIHKDIRQEMEEIAKNHDTKVFNRVIRQCVALSYALREHKDIFIYKIGHSESASNGAWDYTHFIRELLEEE